MNILLFEFVSGGGFYQFPDLGEPSGSLLTEGMAMLQAAYNELTVIDGLHIQIPLDSRCVNSLPSTVRSPSAIIHSSQQLHEFLDQASRTCDKIFIIAPEIDDALLFYTQRLGTSSKLLSPGTDVVRLASDKWATHRFLTQHQIPTPHTVLVEELNSNPLESLSILKPVILKPRWGAGSWALKFLEHRRDRDDNNINPITDYLATHQLDSRSTLIQDYVSGTPASIGIWQTPRSRNFFPAMKQCLDPLTWEYQSCQGPLPDHQQHRAQSLLERILEHLPPFQGYIGVDLVLGKEADNQDYVIEINPRLTTSFCQTRELIDMAFLAELFT